MEDVYGRRIPKDKFIAKTNVTDKVIIFEDTTDNSSVFLNQMLPTIDDPIGCVRQR